MASNQQPHMVDKPETPETPPISQRGPIETEIASTNNPPEAPESVTSSPKDRDGSVISGMTDPGSFDCPPPVAPAADADALSNNGSENLGDVPKQVVLEETPGGASSPTSTQPTEDPTATPETGMRKESANSQNEPLQQDRESVRSNSSGTKSNQEADTDGVNAIDEYIQSPEIQNAIAERSPGGRYIRFNEKLGSGASKDVFRAYDTQEGIEVAWNVVNLSGVPKTERNRIVNEVRLLERLHHQNIISFHGSWVNRERQEVNFVTEILSSGTLKSFINKVQVIRWKIAKRWAIQILKGLEYLHSQEPPVIHRDLKCDNIFINGTSGDLRIGDLGLSTVSQNGRVLSVLGTPEFMAPDMYEDTSYDERVDVYAFGMCLLEIFTKEIPYSECSNPAQIYKKVSAGEYPEVLSRLQSKHAREFVKLCLGYRDETGEYIRPKVAELLKHPFLEKRSTDDDEVVVKPPLIKRTIPESTSEVSQSGTPQPRRKTPNDPAVLPSPVQPINTRQQSEGSSATPRAGQKKSPLEQSSRKEEDGDQFEEMQQSEINMRKVKVLMGRDQELEEDEVAEVDYTPTEPIEVVEASEQSDAMAEAKTTVSAHSAPATIPVAEDEPPGQVTTTPVAAVESEKPAPHYLVAAAVIENENPNTRPYADDNLKLVVTLPVDGQTQNVQFDFHLVEDDPVQVAKEMVLELGIPQGAVLEISETISGLARKARMRQDRYANQKQSAQFQQGMAPAQQVQIQPQGYEQPQYHHQRQGSHHGHHQLPVQGVIQSGSSQQDFQQFQLGLQPSMNQGQLMMHHGNMSSEAQQRPDPQYQQQQGGHHVQQQQLQHPGYSGAMAPGAPMPQGGHVHIQGGAPHPHQIHFHQQGVQQPMPMQQPNQVGGPMPQEQQHYQPMAQQVPEQHSQYQQQGVSQDQQHYQQQGIPQEQQQYQQQGVPKERHQYQQHVPHQEQHQYQQQGGSQEQQQYQQAVPAPHAQQPMPLLQPGSTVPRGHTGGAPQEPQPQAPHQGGAPTAGPQIQQSSALHVQSARPMNVQDSQSNYNVSPNQETQAPVVGVLSGPGPTSLKLWQTAQPASSASLPPPVPDRGESGTDTSSSPQFVPSTARSMQPSESAGQSPKGSHRSESIGSNSSTCFDDDGDEELNEELQRLDEEFQKSMERAKKVFDTRLDNLQRSQVEKEAQHQKTLEKHEKERIEFEKRLAQEEEKRNQRIAQLQKDWNERRKTVRKQKNGNLSSLEMGHDSSQQNSGSTAEHKRSASHASSTFSISPSIVSHKQSQEAGGGDGPTDNKE